MAAVAEGHSIGLDLADKDLGSADIDKVPLVHMLAEERHMGNPVVCLLVVVDILRAVAEEDSLVAVGMMLLVDSWGPMEYDNGVNILCKTNLLVQYNLIELHRRNATNPSLVPNDPLFRNELQL